jgi:hypothetical protein
VCTELACFDKCVTLEAYVGDSELALLLALPLCLPSHVCLTRLSLQARRVAQLGLVDFLSIRIGQCASHFLRVRKVIVVGTNDDTDLDF